MFNLLLQLLDDGRLTDNKGRVVDFKNTIVIMTSHLQKEQLSSFFRPEFLNRVDDIVVFKSLEKKQIREIVRMTVNDLAGRLKERNIDLVLTDSAASIMADESYDPVYGARPVKRYVQNHVENEIARMIIAGEAGDGDRIRIGEEGGQLKFYVE